MEFLLVSIKSSVTWDRRGLTFLYVWQAIKGVNGRLHFLPYEKSIQFCVFTLSDS